MRETIEIVDGNKAQRKIVFNTPTTKQEILIDSVNWKKIGLSTSKNFKEKIRELKDSAPQIKEQKKTTRNVNTGISWQNNRSNSGGAIPEAGNSGGGNSGGGNSGAVIPEAAIPEAVIPEAVIPEAVIPEAVIPEAVIPAEEAIPEAEKVIGKLQIFV